MIRDEFGKPLVARVRRVRANWSVEIGECAAALFGVELALRYGYSMTQLEGDSMIVVQAIVQKVKGHTPFHMLLDNILHLSGTSDCFGCSFVKRGGNTLSSFDC